MMQVTKKITVLDLDYLISMSAKLAEFGKPFDENYRADLLRASGLKWAVHYAEKCLGWIWYQWLLGASAEQIRREVEPFVARGLELRKHTPGYDRLPQHDLLLLHCAIFASPDRQLMEVVETIADASGHKGQRPVDNGELYAAAWCGMMKYWILGDTTKTQEQAGLIWTASRDNLFFAAPKTLVVPWLKKDWPDFVHQQPKDFERLWKRVRKDAYTIKSESEMEIVVRIDGLRIASMWCWAHCGMALLAHRQGAQIVTDSLWLPRRSVE